MAERKERTKNSPRSSSPSDTPTSDGEAEMSVADIAKSAREHIAALTGKSAVSVTSVDPTDDGWLVEVEIVEEERIPSSIDVLALYELELDDGGQLVSYRRTSRYGRGSSVKGS